MSILLPSNGRAKELQTRYDVWRPRQNHRHSILTSLRFYLHTQCPFCPKPTMNDPSNLHKLYIKTTNGGAYYCFRCGSKGSWYDFVKRYRGFSTGDEVPSTLFSRKPPSTATDQPPQTSSPDYKISPQTYDSIQPLTLPSATSQKVYSASLETSSFVLNYLLKTRGLSLPVLRKYGVGSTSLKFQSKNGWEDSECVTFPWLLKAEEINRLENFRGCKSHVEGEGEVLKRKRINILT